jgi:membrane-bound metal-dependent hydrolase YbcI (DUF457 family)
MPSTFVHGGLAILLGAALLRREYDRRAIALLLGLVVLTDLDSFAGPVIAGAHRSLFHTLLIPVGATLLLYYDTRVRDTSWLIERYGTRGLRLAWVAVVVQIWAAILLDYTHLDGVGLFFPLSDDFYKLEGTLGFSLDSGLVQTFVEFQTDSETGTTTADLGKTGTREETHVATPVQPDANSSVVPTEDESVNRSFPLAVGGWQLYLILVGLFTVAAKRLQCPDPGSRLPDEDDQSPTDGLDTVMAESDSSTEPDEDSCDAESTSSVADRNESDRD